MSNFAYVPRDEGFAKARQYVQRALELEPHSAVALTRLASIKFGFDHDWLGAEVDLKRAIALEPQSRVVLQTAATFEAVQGRFDEAYKLNLRAIQLDPLWITVYWNQATICLYSGRFAEAEAAYKKVIELNPERTEVHAALAMVYIVQSKKSAALAELRKERDERWRLWALALYQHLAKNPDEADRALNELIEKYRTGMDYQIAEIHAYRGDADKGFEWLENAYKEHDSGLLLLNGDPLLRNLHRDPRWHSFKKKMNFPT